MEPFLYRVGSKDPTTMLLITIAILALGMLASYLPARRAAAVDPAVVLRAE